MEKFLAFWSTHNTLIIEVLVALIMALAVYVAYRMLFAKNPMGDSSEGIKINTQAIEKTLEKLLENQKSAKPSEDLGVQFNFDENMDLSDLSKIPPKLVEAVQKQVEAKSTQEVQKLKVELQTKEKEVQNMRVEIENNAKVAPAAVSVANPELEGKVKDLEARLSEYEIISEEIADLSKFKDENKRLREELDKLRKGSVSAAPAATAPVVEEAVTAVPPVEAQPASPAPSVDAASGVSLDDDLMKEFAAAVENQKSGSVDPVPEPVQSKSEDTKELIDEFENFVKKS